MLCDLKCVVGKNRNLFMAEYHCHGPGAETQGRVPWSKQLTEKEAESFITIDFIDGKSWLPVYIHTGHSLTI